MAAANESQGLKIAVATFVSLSVILMVTSYFLYSNYDQATQQLAAARGDEQKAKKAQSDILTQYEEMKRQIGSRLEDYEAVKSEIKNETKKIDDEIAALGPMVVEVVGKVQAAGGASPALDEVKTAAATLASTYQSEPNKNFISSLARLKDMLKNEARLAAVLAGSYTELRRSLETANTVNKQQMDVVVKARDDAKADVEGEQKKHIEARADLHERVDQYQTEINNKNTEIATLNSQMRQYREETEKKLTSLNNVIRELRDAQAQTETVLDRPDGHVTYVDHARGEARTDITYGMGARPQMKLTIFDSGSPGIPTEKPKGTIELFWVGERYSLARIVEQKNPVDPIRPGDIVYSPAWSPNEPMRFALIGKLDINRDGKDDRQDLIRMIEAAGGIVDYDLPPPLAGASKERGKITGRDAWYVIDDPKDRPPLAIYENRREELDTPEYAEFVKKRSAAIREARDNGVRPLRIERLLNYLGYSYNAPIRGGVEAVDRNTLKNLVRPQPNAKKAAAPSTSESADTPKDTMPNQDAQPK